MPQKFFEEPFLAFLDGQLIPESNRYFSWTAKNIPNTGELLANIGPKGDAGLDWVIDHRGQFFAITSRGLIPKTFFQRLGLTRQKERLKIEDPRPITIGEFKSRIADVKDRYDEAPMAAFTREILRKYSDDRIVDLTLMEEILGE